MPTTLEPGDIALVGVSSDTGGKSFAFVILTALEPGTVISFTDNGWLSAGGFRSGEGTVTYTVPAGGVAAGTVITIGGLTGSLNPSTAGDQIIAYQQNGSVITPLYGVDFADGNTSWAANATSSNTSAVPAGLTVGQTALAFGPDNAAYTGPLTGSPAEILANIANPANWTTNDATPVAYPAGFTVTGDTTTVSIGDVTITEGTGGDTIMTFTVTRSDTAGAFTVDFATGGGNATAGADYDSAGGTLSFTAGGPATQTISVVVHGDGAMEPNETFNVVLSNVVNTTGEATLLDGAAVGTILNDDIQLTAIYDIQGAGHTSAYDGQRVITEGVVIAIDTTGSRGFWIQDPNGDGNDATSDAVFVFTNAAPTVSVGQLVRVDGTVTEFQGSNPNNLTVTEITAPTITVIGTGTVEAVVLGAGGRLVPTENIDDDGLTTYDPTTDAIDFYESLEGMLVTVPDAQAVAANDGNSTWVVADSGAGATGMNGQGGITIQPGDYNPEKIQIWADSGVLPGFTPDYVMGDSLGDVTGVMHYFGGNYEVVATQVGNTTSAGSVPDEVTTLNGDRAHLEVASYNVENLSPNDDPEKFEALAEDITVNLGSPDIISLIEIQDADGTGNGSNLSGAATAQLLIDAIVAAGGPQYVYIEIAPTTPNSTGGAGNGNIRNGFLYNPATVDYVEGSIQQIPDLNPTNGNAFNNSRMPLVAEFIFHGEVITAISVHNYARSGGDELFGENQPAGISGDQRRNDQTAAINAWLEDFYAANPDAQVAVMGDFNGFYWETAQTQLETAGGLYNLTWTLSVEDRYSYVFQGNAQQLDHMFVTTNLVDGAQFDIVHMNSGESDPVTDHDALFGLLYINSAPTTAADAYFGSEDSAIAGNAFTGVLSNDTDKNADAIHAVLQQGPMNGLLNFNADGSFTYTPNADWSGTDSFLYVAYDEFGEASGATLVEISVAAVNDVPLGEDDAASVLEDGAVLIDALANDSDVDGDALSIVLEGSTSSLGASVSVVDGQIRYDADADAFDLLAPGQTVQDVVAYRVSDGQGGLSDLVFVTVTVTGAADNRSLNGTVKSDLFTDAAGFDTTFFGNNGEDALNGGDGADVLYGENGKDTLNGGAGSDTLIGGTGNDLLWGGAGADAFVFTTNSGTDTIMDFNPFEDTIVRDGGGALSFQNVDTNNDGVMDAVEVSGAGMGKVILAGLTLDAMVAGGYLTSGGQVVGDWLI